MKRIYFIIIILLNINTQNAMASEVFGNISNAATVSNTISGSILNVTVNGITLSNNSPSVSLSNSSTGIFSLSIPDNVTNTTLDMSSLVSGNRALMPVTVFAAGNINNVPVSITIPSGTTVTAATTTWDGIISLPRTSSSIVTPTAAVGNSLTITSSIEMGSQLFRINFSNSVRLVFGGLSNNYVGYMNGSTFVPIVNSCAIDSQAWADVSLATNGECYMPQGSNLIIWTKHFTTFGTYTQQPIIVPSSGGGGGGGGGYTYIPPTNQTNNNSSNSLNNNINKCLSDNVGNKCMSNSDSNISNFNNSHTLTRNFTFKKLIKKGSKGEDVIELQTFLISKNFLAAQLFSKANPMGTFGPATEKALKAYQKSIRLDQTGTLGPKTRESINIEYIKVQNKTSHSTSASQSKVIPYDPSNSTNLEINKNIITPNATTSKIDTSINNDKTKDEIKNNIELYKDLKIGDQGDRVKALQKVLIKKGLLWTNATGIYGDGTAGAWRDYKKLLNK